MEYVVETALSVLLMLCIYIAKETARHSAVLFGPKGASDEGVYGKIVRMERHIRHIDTQHRDFRRSIQSIKATLVANGMVLIAAEDDDDAEGM